MQVEMPLALMAGEDVLRAVGRHVVSGNDEVDAVLEVVAEELLDDVDLVADEQREDDHRPSLMKRRALDRGGARLEAAQARGQPPPGKAAGWNSPNSPASSTSSADRRHGTLERLACKSLAQRVADPRVVRERSVGETLRERVVVDEQPRRR